MSTPITPEDILKMTEAELDQHAREQGLDPDDLLERGQAVVDKVLNRITPEELDAIRKRVEALPDGLMFSAAGGMYTNDRELAAHARTDIPKLLDELDKLNAEIEAAAVYIQAGIDNDPDFPNDPRWAGVRTWIETRESK